MRETVTHSYRYLMAVVLVFSMILIAVFSFPAQSSSAKSTSIGTIERINLSSTGVQADSECMTINCILGSSISADGRYVAFISAAPNLVDLDTNNKPDIFVRDRQTGVTERVSVSSEGVQANDSSAYPSISADGRYVAFSSLASNLVNSDTNANEDVFVHDRQTGTTEMVSVSANGEYGNGRSWYASITADGRYVAFASAATNLVGGDPTWNWDIFVHDRQTGTNERVSVSSSGVLANSFSTNPYISASGQFVAFYSEASNLVDGDTNHLGDVFVHDRQAGTTKRVSISSTGQQGYGISGISSISADGRYIAFVSEAANLVDGDTNNRMDSFVHDLLTGNTERVSVSSNGEQSNGLSFSPSITDGGRLVTFNSSATNLVEGDTNAMNDIFVHDRQTGSTELVSVTSNGEQANNHSYTSSISSNGRYITFWSEATNLVEADTNNNMDLFFMDRCPDGSCELENTFSISGRITDDRNQPLPQVQISAGTNISTTTGTDGSYTLVQLSPGTYTLTPSLSGYTFSPLTRSIIIANANSTGQDFIGIGLQHIFLPVVIGGNE